MRDAIYQSQEAEIVQLKSQIDVLKQQTDELSWLNSLNEENSGKLFDKIVAKKKKIREEREKHRQEKEKMVNVYEKYIRRLQKITRRDHDRFAQ